MPALPTTLQARSQGHQPNGWPAPSGLKTSRSGSEQTRVSTARSSLRLRLAAVSCGDHRDAGGVIAGWLLKLTVVLGVLAIIGYDAVSIASSKVTASDTAGDAAMAGSVSWSQSHDVQAAYDAADSVAAQHSCTVLTKGFSIDKDGGVHLTVQKRASTLVVTRIEPVRHWATLSSTGFAKDVS